MIMVSPKNLKSYLLLLAILVCSLWARCCRAQGNRSDPCETSGRCGPFGICNSQGPPTCTCLRGFEPLNVMEWNLGNWSSGCRRRVPLNCGGSINGGKPDGFVKIDQVQIEGLSQRLPGTQNQCQGLCFANCSCLAYGFDPNVGCVAWGGDLMNIHYFSSGSGSDLHLRVANSELDQKKGSKIIIIIPVVIGLVILLSILAYIYWRRIAKRRRGKERSIELGRPEDLSPLDNSLDEALSQVNLEELPLYKFEILAIATHNFSDANKLGKGGFGTVYKGELGDGREVAVKRLSQASTQGMREFMNELVLISKLQHRNLVRLLGFCVENRETILIYEYMPNKSLDFYLFDPSQEILDWGKRFNIIEGICRGLLYLHRDSILTIIHRDLKPSNILLDNDWNPKISDFGMARIFGNQQDHVSTVRVVGTYGYMAPEYAKKGRFSEKTDVFSFGVLILEIATGRRNRSFYHQDGSLNLLGHVWKLWNEDNIAALIDRRISDPSYRPEVMRCIHIGLLCVQESSVDRPSTSNVLSLLSSEIIELPEPKQPAFTIDSSRSDTGTNSSQLNNVSITMVDGR